MIIRENGKMYKFVQLARAGDIIAKNKLIEQNYDLIVAKANDCYKILNGYYYQIYNELMPSYIIDLDEVIQCFSVRAIELINIYLKGDCNIYFNNYLNLMLSSYISKFVNTVLCREKVRKENEFISHIHYDTFELLNIPQNKLKNDLKLFSVLDKRLSNFDDFINYILNGYSYDQLKDITGLDKRRVNMKIKYIAELYKERLSKLGLVSDLNIEEIFNKIENNKLLDVYYYKVLIYEYINEFYDTLCLISCINYDELVDSVIKSVNNFVKRYLNNNQQDIKMFNDSLQIHIKEHLRYIKKKGGFNGKN